MLDDDAQLDDKPLADVVDQHRPARADDTGGDDGDPLDDLATSALEADPADVVDQRRPAPVLPDDEPWP